jgi:SNF2 family DNA or RNA helicase
VAVEYVTRARRVLIADDVGLGKSFEALASLEALDAWPAAVVCPAVMKYQWEAECRRLLPHRAVAVLEGTKAEELPPADLWIANYDILAGAWESLLRDADLRGLVLDESHAIKNRDAKRTKSCLRLGRGVPVRICLTGTPVVNRPADLIQQLKFLGRLDDMGGFWHFAKRWCGAVQRRFGWDFSGATHLDELASRLRATCMVRREKGDVIHELPPLQRAIVPVEIDNPIEYHRAEEDVAEWSARNAIGAEELEALEGLDPEDRERLLGMARDTARAKARAAEALVKLSALRQLVAKGKLGAAKAWINEFLASGKKLIVFCWHREIAEALVEEYRCPAILGGVPAAERQRIVERFQSDQSLRLVILQIRAAGVGITLTAASDMLFVETGWTPADQDQTEGRAHRQGQEERVTAHYLVGRDTIDEWMQDLVMAKRQVTGEVSGQGLPLAEILSRLNRKEQWNGAVSAGADAGDDS